MRPSESKIHRFLALTGVPKRRKEFEMENPGIRKKRRIEQRDWRPLMVLNCHTVTRNKYD